MIDLLKKSITGILMLAAMFLLGFAAFMVICGTLDFMFGSINTWTTIAFVIGLFGIGLAFNHMLELD